MKTEDLKEMKIDLALARSIYGKGDGNVRKALEEILGDSLKEPYNGVKTLGDAVRFLGASHPLVRARDALTDLGTSLTDGIANDIELRIICAALNGNKRLAGRAVTYYPKFVTIPASQAHTDYPEWMEAYRPVRCGTGSLLFIYDGVASMKRDYCLADPGLGFICKETAAYAGREFIGYYKKHFGL